MPTETGLSPFGWSEAYSVGNQEIDAQHKKLLALAGDLHRTVAEGKGPKALYLVLQALVQESEQHFALEEEFMASRTYAGLAAHKQTHRKLTQEMRNLSGRARDGKLSSTLDMTSLLRRWLVDHITGDDQTCARALRLRDPGSH